MGDLWMIYGCLMEDLRVISNFYVVAKQWHLFLAIGFRPSLRPTDVLTTRYLMIIPYAPWCWYIYLQNCFFCFWANVGIHIPAPWSIDAYFFTGLRM